MATPSPLAPSAVMFPVHVVVETVRDGDCSRCADAGAAVLADSYAIVGGATPLTQLVDTVLAALGLHQLAFGAKGMIQVKNWKPLTFAQITEDLDATVESLLKDISNHLTLKILAKRADSATEDCLSDMKERLLRASLNRNPQILASIKNPQLKEFVSQLLEGSLQGASVSAEHIQGFNNWLEDLAKGGLSPGDPTAPYHSASTRFNQMLELPKLQRWFQENPNPTRQKLLQFMHTLNNSNFRRHNTKITYQQICNWFSNARAIHRQKEQRWEAVSSSRASPPNSRDTVPKVFGSDVRNISLDFNEFIQYEAVKPENGTSENGSELTEPSKDDGAESGSRCLSNGEPPKMEEEDSPLCLSVDVEPGAAESQSPLRPFVASPDSQADFPHSERRPPSLHHPNSALYNGSLNRSRLMFDPLSELPLLEKWFEENPHPSWIQIDQFTETLNSMSYRQTYPPVSTHNVKIWFKNRRAKCKRLLGSSEK